MRGNRAMVLGALLLSSPALAASTTINIAPENAHDAEIGQALERIQAHKPSEAVPILDKVIAAYQQAWPGGVNRCAENLQRALIVSASVAAAIEKQSPSADGKPTTINMLGPGWCTALWARGYALIDLNQSPQAELALAQAVEMAPTNAHYLNEYAELFKARREWQRSYDLFSRAWDISDHNPKGAHPSRAARALRGMAYNRVELGDLKEAKRLYDKSLIFEPDSPVARSELDYIARKMATGN